jgi:hypothetical protein
LCRLDFPIIGPLDVGILAPNARHHERSDIHPHAIVEIGMPVDRLLVPGPSR